MRKLGLGLIAALAVLIMGCVEAEPDRTNVVIERDAPPASSTTIIKDDGESKAPDTDVDIEIDTSAPAPK